MKNPSIIHIFRTKKQMKVLLVWCLTFVLSFQKAMQMECSNFWKLWNQTSCTGSIPGDQVRCFSFSQKVFAVSNKVVIMDCNSQTIENDLYACIKYPYGKSFYIEDCILLNLEMKKFLSGKSVSNIKVMETGVNLTTADMIISNIPSLKTFSLNGHKARGRFNITFSYLDNLHSITVTNTSYTHFRNRPFLNVPYLQELSFTHGILRSIPETLFKGLGNLKILNMSHNRIISLRRGTFNDLADLRELDLTYNRLRVIIGGTFKPLINLYEIKISHNPLSYLPDTSPFGMSQILSVVRATNCRLTKNPNVNLMQHNLTLLDFSFNIIETAALPVYTKNITIMNLTNNFIKNIRINLDKVSDSFPSYYIHNSALICDCGNEEFLQFLHSDIQEEHRVFPDADFEVCHDRRSIKLIDAWPKHMNCPIRNCPKKCTCSQTVQGIRVDCRGLGLKFPPDRIPFGTVIILLQRNNISSLTNLDQYLWQKLTRFYLDNNIFTDLHDKFIPKKVKLMSIKDNKLTTLPVSFMKKIESIDQYKIYLTGNDWQCICWNVPFVNWFTRNEDKINEWKNVYCTDYQGTYSSKSRSPIFSIPVHLLCINIFQFSIIFILFLLLLLVLLLFLGALFYHRTSILPLLYSYNIYPFILDDKIIGDGGKEFDVFMFYHKSDVEIAKLVVAKLEPEHKVCIPHGEWYPDQAVGHEIVRSFECSRKTIVLVSRGLVLSSWFQVEFRAAFYDYMKNKLNRFVLISINDVGDTEHLKIDIRNFLINRMRFKWKERCFWQKLRFALRHTVRNTND